MVSFNTPNTLSPILLRVFGNYPLNYLDLIPEEFKDSLYILTTNDYKGISFLQEQFGNRAIIYSGNSEMAIKNSGKFLNFGIERLKENSIQEVILISSGFETSLRKINTLINSIARQYDKNPLDIIYFLLPDIHFPNGIPGSNLEFNLDISFIFPSESLVWINLKTLPLFDTELSIKGALGYTDSGIPLGGIELMLTLMQLYADKKDSLNMVGVETSIIRGNHNKVSVENNESTSQYIEATPNQHKLIRRKPTIEAARKKLFISEEEFPAIFKNLQLTKESSLI